jgi:uncharacterized BrkB/YihY/UPF0761 family membrane protein
VIIFLIWMWISNVAVLLGAEFNAELERGHAMAAGQPPAGALLGTAGRPQAQEEEAPETQVITVKWRDVNW